MAEVIDNAQAVEATNIVVNDTDSGYSLVAQKYVVPPSEQYADTRHLLMLGIKTPTNSAENNRTLYFDNSDQILPNDTIVLETASLSDTDEVRKVLSLYRDRLHSVKISENALTTIQHGVLEMHLDHLNQQASHAQRAERTRKPGVIAK